MYNAKYIIPGVLIAVLRGRHPRGLAEHPAKILRALKTAHGRHFAYA